MHEKIIQSYIRSLPCLHAFRIHTSPIPATKDDSLMWHHQAIPQNKNKITQQKMVSLTPLCTCNATKFFMENCDVREVPMLWGKIKGGDCGERGLPLAQWYGEVALPWQGKKYSEWRQEKHNKVNYYTVTQNIENITYHVMAELTPHLKEKY